MATEIIYINLLSSLEFLPVSWHFWRRSPSDYLVISKKAPGKRVWRSDGPQGWSSYWSWLFPIRLKSYHAHVFFCGCKVLTGMGCDLAPWTAGTVLSRFWGSLCCFLRSSGCTQHHSMALSICLNAFGTVSQFCVSKVGLSHSLGTYS